MADYLIGTAVTLTATFKDSAAALADPGTVKFKVLNPDGTTDTYTYGVNSEVVKDSTGVYHMTIEPASAGPFYWRVEGVGGSVDTAGEDSFSIDPGVFSV